MAAPRAGALFKGPVSVILIGDDRPLLNWVAYALASFQDPDFVWVDLRSTGEVLSDLDPLARNVIPSDRLQLAHASDLVPDHVTANIAVSGVIRDDELPENVQVLLDFLRLPRRTQEALSAAGPVPRLKTYVLSNAHRLGSLYPVRIVGPLLRAIKETGTTTIMTFADAPNDGRFAFDLVIHLTGHGAENWRQATLRVEKGLPDRPLQTGSESRLGDLQLLADVIASHIP
jgi:hypothetical protein